MLALAALLISSHKKNMQNHCDIVSLLGASLMPIQQNCTVQTGRLATVLQPIRHELHNMRWPEAEHFLHTRTESLDQEGDVGPDVFLSRCFADHIKMVRMWDFAADRFCHILQSYNFRAINPKTNHFCEWPSSTDFFFSSPASKQQTCKLNQSLNIFDKKN